MPMEVSPALRRAARLWKRRYQGVALPTFASTAALSSTWAEGSSQSGISGGGGWLDVGPATPSHHMAMPVSPFAGTSRWAPSVIVSGQPSAFPRPRFVYLSP